jgi:hypothetical protein
MSNSTVISNGTAVTASIFANRDKLLMTISYMNRAGFSEKLTSNRNKFTTKSISQTMAVALITHQTAIMAFARTAQIAESADGAIVATVHNGYPTIQVNAVDSTMKFGKTKASYICAVMAQIGEFSQMEAPPAKDKSIAHETIANTYYSDKKEQFFLKLSYTNGGWHNSLALDVCQVQDILASLKHVQAFVDAWVAKNKNHGIPAEMLGRTEDGYPFLKLEHISFGFTKALVMLAYIDLLKAFEKKVMNGVQETKNIGNRLAKLETSIWTYVGYDSKVLTFPMLTPDVLHNSGEPTMVIDLADFIDFDNMKPDDAHQELNTIDTEPDTIMQPKFLNCDALMIETLDDVVEITPSFVEFDLISQANAV